MRLSRFSHRTIDKRSPYITNRIALQQTSHDTSRLKEGAAFFWRPLQTASYYNSLIGSAHRELRHGFDSCTKRFHHNELFGLFTTHTYFLSNTTTMTGGSDRGPSLLLPFLDCLAQCTGFPDETHLFITTSHISAYPCSLGQSMHLDSSNRSAFSISSPLNPLQHSWPRFHSITRPIASFRLLHGLRLKISIIVCGLVSGIPIIGTAFQNRHVSHIGAVLAGVTQKHRFRVEGKEVWATGY